MASIWWDIEMTARVLGLRGNKLIDSRGHGMVERLEMKMRERIRIKRRIMMMRRIMIVIISMMMMIFMSDDDDQ